MNTRNRTLIETPVIHYPIKEYRHRGGLFLWLIREPVHPLIHQRASLRWQRQPTGNAPVLSSLEGCYLLVQFVSCLVKYSI